MDGVNKRRMQIKRGYLHYEGRLLGEEIRKIKKVIPKTFSVKEKEADKLRMWTVGRNSSQVHLAISRNNFGAHS